MGDCAGTGENRERSEQRGDRARGGAERAGSNLNFEIILVTMLGVDKVLHNSLTSSAK